jgi:hypothetical protein
MWVSVPSAPLWVCVGFALRTSIDLHGECDRRRCWCLINHPVSTLLVLSYLLFQCHALSEELEQYIDEWWFQKQDEDLYKYLCIDTLKRCCPDHHYGASCSPCPGFPNNVCNRSGKCKVGCRLWTPIAWHITNITCTKELKKKLNSMVWVRERTIPTERPPLVSEVIANFCG